MAGNDQALKMTTWMVDYFYNRVQNVISKYTVARHYKSLNEETGGMNDVLYKLYSISVSNSYEFFGAPGSLVACYWHNSNMWTVVGKYSYYCELWNLTSMFRVNVIRQIQSIYCWLTCLTSHAF